MDWLESINIIRKAQENNQLVVFVGAGVSKNSGMPSWSELINSISDKIGYAHSDRCLNCDKRNQDCPKNKCEERHQFSQDEFLRIPEYFYQTDLSENHQEYYNLILENLCSDKKSNPIDYEIFNLLPHHIITTNYDSLLETSENSYTNLYTVVSQDSDLLSKPNERYLIKMHGDFDVPESIVLKESDYLDYEQEHPLISTFIRSLLVNHSFLFLGYSLNDYNLNLIIGWINYFQKKYKVEERPKSFLIDCKTPSEHEQMRQKSKNIFVVDISEIPTEVLQKVQIPDQLESEVGKRLYTYLCAISSPKILEEYVPLDKVLKEKYETLESYNKISFYDLDASQKLGRTYFAGTEIVFYDDDWYLKVANMLQSENGDIISYFKKAGITAIHNFNNDTRYVILESQIESDSHFKLYLNNDYLLLREALGKNSNSPEKLYYSYLLGAEQSQMNTLLSQMYQETSSTDYISLLMCKMRERLVKLTLFDRQEALTKEIERLFDTVPEKYRKAVGFLKMLFESSAKQMVEMQEILDKQEKRNEYGRSGWESGHAFTHIWKLQAFAYDYYYFFKRNYLPLDYFNDVSRYLSYYIQAILCSYTPVAPSDTLDTFVITTDHRPYPINDIDLDILVKFTNSKSLESWLKKYSVQSIDVSECNNILDKYTNLCNSFADLSHRNWPAYIMNFSSIICIANMDSSIKENAFKNFIAAFEKAALKSAALCESLFDSLYYMIRHLNIELSKEITDRLLLTLLKDNVYKTLVERHHAQFSFILKKYSGTINKDLQQYQVDLVEGQAEIKAKVREIYQRRFLLPETYNAFLRDNVNALSPDAVFNILIEKRIDYTPQIQECFINTIKSEAKARKDNPGTRSYPDRLAGTIEECIILKLLDFDVDIALLRPYTEYSLHLQFMLDPDHFDYSKVNTNNYMWQNLIYSKAYGRNFVKNKDTILSQELKDIFSMGLETTEQQKIVYGLLLNDKELRNFK